MANPPGPQISGLVPLWERTLGCSVFSVKFVEGACRCGKAVAESRGAGPRAVEARGEVGLGNLFSGVCLQAERSAGPRRSWSRRCWWIRREREGNAKANAKANAKGTEKEREGHAKRKREGNAKPKGMLKAEKGIRRGVTTSRARAPLACAVPVRVPRNSHARARGARPCTMQRMLWRPLWLGVGVDRHLPKAKRRCLGIRGVFAQNT